MEVSTMDSKTLQAYITLYQTKSIHKAADQLFISQQGLSRMLQNMEKEYQCKFFLRSHVGLVPTPEGERYYQTALRMQRELNALSGDLRDIADGKVSISIACSFGTMHMLYSRIQKFYRKYPNIVIHWREYPDLEADQLLERGETNLLFYVTGDGQEDFDRLPIFSNPFGVLVYDGHPLWERSEIALEELKDEWLLLEGRQFHIYRNFINRCERAGFYPEIIAETTEISLCHKLCSMGEGLAVIPQFIAEEYEQEQVRWIPFADGESNLRFSGGLARIRNRDLNDAEQKFWNFITRNRD